MAKAYTTQYGDMAGQGPYVTSEATVPGRASDASTIWHWYKYSQLWYFETSHFRIRGLGIFWLAMSCGVKAVLIALLPALAFIQPFEPFDPPRASLCII